jgi:hypothetical protein
MTDATGAGIRPRHQHPLLCITTKFRKTALLPAGVQLQISAILKRGRRVRRGDLTSSWL